jgi:hypothetical protein
MRGPTVPVPPASHWLIGHTGAGGCSHSVGARSRMQLAALRMLLLAVAPARTSVAGGGSLHFRSAPGGAGPDLSTIDAVRTDGTSG